MDLAGLEESMENLARTKMARARMGQPLGDTAENGVVFDIMEEEYFNDYDDEEVFDDELLATFSQCEPGLGASEDEGSKKKDERWCAKGYIISHDFSEIESQLKDMTVDGSIKKLVLREGTGKKVSSGKIYYHYMNFVEGSEEPFDTSLLGKYPALVDLRQSRFPLLPGYEMALRSMEMHEVAQFIIKPELMYGAAGCPPRIPENSKILFVAEIVHIIGEEMLKTAPYMTSEERAYLPFETIVEEVKKLNTMGNGNYEYHNFDFAIRKYRKARCMLEDYPTQNEEEGNLRSYWLRKLCRNIAQSYIRCGKAPQACVACKLGMKECEDDDPEAMEFFWRFAKAKLMLKDVEAAKGLIDQAYQIAPKNKFVLKIRDEVYKEKKIQDNGHRAMCKRMFSNNGPKRALISDSDHKVAPKLHASTLSANQPSSSKGRGKASAELVNTKGLTTLQQDSERARIILKNEQMRQHFSKPKEATNPSECAENEKKQNDGQDDTPINSWVSDDDQDENDQTKEECGKGQYDEWHKLFDGSSEF